MELKGIENGQITRHQIVDILDEFRNGIRNDVSQQIELIQGVPGLVRQLGRNAAGVDANRGRGTLYTYNGRFWDIPGHLAFQLLWNGMLVSGGCGCKGYQPIQQCWVRTVWWSITRSSHFECSYLPGCQRKLPRPSSCIGGPYIQWWRRVLLVTFLRSWHRRLSTTCTIWERSIWEQGLLVTCLQTTNCITMIGSSRHGQSTWAAGAWLSQREQQMTSNTYLLQHTWTDREQLVLNGQVAPTPSVRKGMGGTAVVVLTMQLTSHQTTTKKHFCCAQPPKCFAHNLDHIILFLPIVAIPVCQDLNFELILDVHLAMENTNIGSSDWTRQRWMHSSPACHAWNTSKPGIRALCHSHYHDSMPFPHLASKHLATDGEFAVDIMNIVSKKVPSTLKYSSTPVQQYQVIKKIHLQQYYNISHMKYCISLCLSQNT